MRFLTDENIPLNVVKRLKENGIDVTSVFHIMRGSSDSSIIRYAFENDFIIITFDKDFGHLIYKDRIKSKGVMLLRFAPKSSEFILRILLKLLLIEKFDPTRKFVVVYENHFRVVNLPKIL